VAFVDPNISTDAELRASVAAEFPEINNATLSYILGALYPAANYSTPFQRAVQIASDAAFSCLTRYLAVAKGGHTYNYLFAMPPGYHADDTPYTFYDGDSSTLDDGYPVDVSIAHALQDSIVGFTLAGDPNKAPTPLNTSLPLYGSNALVAAFTDSGLLTRLDDMDNVRCAWWQHAMIEGLV